MTEKDAGLARRAFLRLGVTGGGAALGSALAASAAAASGEQPEAIEPLARDGYRESEQVRRYYRLARF